jgi:type VI secretion system secreted protein VgrG
VVSPGPVSWVTAAAAFTLIGNSHTTNAPNVSVKVLGGLAESQGSIFVGSKGYILRKVSGPASSTVSGALSVSAGGGYGLSAASVLTLKVGGSLTLNGGPVSFKCGASEIVASAGGVLIKSPSITITGSCDQAGLLTHK